MQDGERLPAALAAQVNFSPIAVGVAGPVENLTYNAVPPRFLGRVRTISEALLQPPGLAVGGLMLAAYCGSTIRVRTEGDDAEDALTALTRLVESKFGEEE